MYSREKPLRVFTAFSGYDSQCLRLMDVDDRHIDTLIGARETMKNGKERQAISNSALYRLAGNSIVVNCMTLMFENLLYPDTEPTTGDQLKLF